MKSVTKIVIILVALAILAGILIHRVARGREFAIQTLKVKYGAEIDDQLNDFYVTISGGDIVDDKGKIVPNPHEATLSTKDLSEVGRLLNKAGPVDGLSLLNFPALTSLNGIEVVGSLKNLVVIDCPELVDSKGIGQLAEVKELVIVDCPEFNNLDELPGIEALKTLDLSGSESLKQLPDLSGLKQLEFILLSTCFSLESLDLTSNPDIAQIQLDGCRSLKSLGGLGNLSKLTDLSLSSCHALESLEGLENLQSLIMFDARNIDVIDFTAVGKLSNLTMLRLAGQEGLTDLTPFSKLAGLREIHLEAMPDLTSLKGMPSGVNQFAGFPHCKQLTTLEGIQAAGDLGSIDVSGCSELRDISAISACKGIVQANFMNCRALSDISPLGDLKELGFVLLGGTSVAEATMGEIQKQLPEARFDFSGGE